MKTVSSAILDQLYDTVTLRKTASPESSYTASLMHKGIDKILKKLGEEAVEVVLAAKGGDKKETVYETADLLYHTVVMLAYHNIPLSDVYEELQRRTGTSGIEEKNSRVSK